MYYDVYKAWRKEIESRDLQELPLNFYEKVILYIRELEEKCERLEDPTMIKLLEEEKRNVKNMLKQLIIKRVSKVIGFVFEGVEIDYEKLPELERSVFKVVESLLRPKKDEVSGKVEKAEESLEGPLHESDEGELVLVRFVRDVPEITGIDLREYGPFKKGDVGTLPLANAKLLMGRGFVELIEPKRDPSK
ncbi:MAG: DNA replication complex subunit Gins51 [Candidatus Asgardarchaeia archaeon]